MIKKIDLYLIKTFFGPFLFIFSVLSFIFIVNIVWIQMSSIADKGLTNWEILKLFSYLSVSVVRLVLPLTILLSAIMTFGGFGERYELVAMKSAGISLLRIMRPLFLLSIVLSVMLYFFSNNIIPDFQRKAKNMLYNIMTARPALNFTPGQFISSVPEMTVKFDDVYGDNNDHVKGVFLHKVANSYEDNQTVVAEKGKFAKALDPNYLKLILYNGYIYQDNVANKDYQQRAKQSNQATKFDTLVLNFDISALLDKQLEAESIKDDYQFQGFGKLRTTIAKQKEDNDKMFKTFSEDLISQQTPYFLYADKSMEKKKNLQPPFQFDSLKKEEKVDAIVGAYNKINNFDNNLSFNKEQVRDNVKYFSKIVMYQQHILSHSVTCLVFFLIGASLGSIIRKGGVGLPVVLAIIIFIFYYIIYLTSENMAWKGEIDPYFATWIPNLVLLPLGIWMTFKAISDSQLFDADRYKTMLQPILKFFKPKEEHARYQ